MKRKRFAAATTAAILAAATAPVALGQTTTVPMPYSDPFNYNAGGLGGQGPWFRANTLTGNDNPVDTSVNLNNYAALPPSTGGSVLLNTQNPTNVAPQDHVNLSASPTTFYYSMLLRVDALNTVNNTVGVFFANTSDVTNTVQGSVGAALRIRKDPIDATKYDLGLDKSGALAASSLWSSGLAIDGSTVLVVVKYAGDGDTSNGTDVNSMWINPVASTFGADESTAPTPDPSLTSASGADRAILSFSLGVRGLTDPKKYVDDVRLGTTWASVVPTVWKGSDSSYGTAANWFTGIVPDAAGIVPSFLNISGASHSVALGSGRILGGMIFSSPTGYTVTGPSLTFSTSDAAGAQLVGSAGDHVIAAPVTLNSNLAVNVTGGSITLSNAVSGPAGVSMTGGGVLALTGANSYGGTTTITGGVIRAADGIGLPSTNLVLNGGAFETTTSSFTRTLGTGANQVQLPGGASGFSAFGSNATVNLGTDLVWASTPGFSPTTLVLNQSTATATIDFQNNIDLNGANRTVAVNSTGSATAATLSGAIVNNAAGTTTSLIKQGSGVLVLASGGNTYNGQTQINGGVLRGVDGVNIPMIVGGNSILTMNGGVYEPTTATFTRPLGATALPSNPQPVRLIGGASGFSAFGTPLVVDIGGDGTGTGAGVTWGSANFQPSTLVLNASTATAGIEFKNAIDLGASAPAARVVAVNADTQAATISGNITGTNATAGLTKVGPGTLVLSSSANSYAGTTTISGGTLAVSSTNDLATSALVISNGATLKMLAGFEPSNGGTRTLTVGSGGGVIDTNGNTPSDFQAPITGVGSFTKAGGGTIVSGQLNSYTGGTILKGGFFEVINDANLGGSSGPITFDGGGLRYRTDFAMSGGRGVINLAAGGGTLDTNAHNLDASANPIEGTGAFNVVGGGSVTTPHIRTPGNLTVNSARMNFVTNGSTTGVSKVGGVSILSGGKLDISDNHLIATSAVGSATAGTYNGVSGLIQSGRNGGGWGGSGIITSQSNATGGNFTSLGVATAQQVKGLANPSDTAVWAGQTVTGSNALLMYTYGGDANLDGKINVDDYGRIDFNVNLGTSGWYNGDFNYDGKINVDDYGIIDFNVGIQGSPFYTSGGSESGPGVDAVSGVSAVPEPASLSVLAMGAASMMIGGRRQRQRRR